VLILGAGTPFGEAFSRIATLRGLDHHLVGRGPEALEKLPNGQAPWAVIDPNFEGDDELVRACGARGIRYLAVTTAQLFQSRRGEAFGEDDVPNAQDPNGRDAAATEARLAALLPGGLIIRSGPLFGPWDDSNFALDMLRGLASGRPIEHGPEIVSPSYLPDLVHTALDLLIDGESGLWHLPNAGQATWSEIADILAERAGLTPPVCARQVDEAMRTSALTSRRGLVMPGLTGALHRFVRECEPIWRARPGLPGIAAE
jgi:dTDP-4-dehydrorhamnose reductase